MSEERLNPDAGEAWAAKIAKLRDLPADERTNEVDALLRCEELQQEAARQISRWRDWPPASGRRAYGGGDDDAIRAICTFFAACLAAPARFEVFWPFIAERSNYMQRMLGPALEVRSSPDGMPLLMFGLSEAAHAAAFGTPHMSEPGDPRRCPPTDLFIKFIAFGEPTEGPRVQQRPVPSARLPSACHPLHFSASPAALFRCSGLAAGHLLPSLQATT